MARPGESARVRFAGWSPQRAWRRGLLAAFIPWAGAVYMPYIYNDMFDYTFESITPELEMQRATMRTHSLGQRPQQAGLAAAR